MSAPDPLRRRIYITDLSKKDLELAYALVFLGEEQSSAENHIWGAHIKEKYDQQTARRIYTGVIAPFPPSYAANGRC